MSQKKLSELMKAGAKRTKEMKGKFFGWSTPYIFPEFACALGCAMLEIKNEEWADHKCLQDIMEHTGVNIETSIRVNRLEPDTVSMLKTIGYSGDGIQPLDILITDVNDKASRSKAIKLVEEVERLGLI